MTYDSNHPIDARLGTTKTDRALLVWFVFGVGRDGLVDIADQDGDVITNITRERADRIVALRNKFVDEAADIINAED